MVKVTLEIDDEDIEFNVPESWEEVTVSQFCKMFSFNREELNPIEIAVKVLHIFTGVDEELLMMMNYEDFNSLVQVISFTNDEVDARVDEYVEIEGEKYYIKSDYSSLTMGEVITIEIMLNESQGNIFKVMDKLLCVFLRKKKDNGKLESFKGTFMERRELFGKASIISVYGLFVFFLSGENLLEFNTKESLEKK